MKITKINICSSSPKMSKKSSNGSNSQYSSTPKSSADNSISFGVSKKELKSTLASLRGILNRLEDNESSYAQSLKKRIARAEEKLEAKRAKAGNSFSSSSDSSSLDESGSTETYWNTYHLSDGINYV